MLTFENRYDAARNKYFAENPQAMKKIEAVSAGCFSTIKPVISEPYTLGTPTHADNFAKLSQTLKSGFFRNTRDNKSCNFLTTN